MPQIVIEALTPDFPRGRHGTRLPRCSMPGLTHAQNLETVQRLTHPVRRAGQRPGHAGRADLPK